jgi:multiple sugar transport system substrate-binding protein
MMGNRVSALLGWALTLSLLAAGCSLSGSQPEEGVLRVWTTWADDPAQIQSLFDRYSEESGQPVKVTTGVDSRKVSRAMAGSTPPDVIVLSSGDLVSTYYSEGLIEPLDRWIIASGIDLDDIYPAPLAQCQMANGAHACLPWGGDVYALFWNKDLFLSAGLDPERPPQTMEELAGYADKLTVRDAKGKLSQIGFVPNFARSRIDLYAHMFGGSWYGDGGAELTVDSQPAIDAANWQLQFYERYDPQAAKEFVSSFDRHMASRHPFYAGKRLSCQQCHRNTPHHKSPDRGFYEGKVAMMVDGQWQVGPIFLPHLQPGLNYGVAPFPPPADHPERASTGVVEGAVAVIPAGATDKEAAAQLLAWMMSPETLAEASYANGSLPTSRSAAQDPRFRQVPEFQVFLDLMAHPNAKHVVASPLNAQLNQALGRIEEEMLYQGDDPVLLLGEVQAELSPKLKEALAH